MGDECCHRRRWELPSLKMGAVIVGDNCCHCQRWRLSLSKWPPEWEMGAVGKSKSRIKVEVTGAEWEQAWGGATRAEAEAGRRRLEREQEQGGGGWRKSRLGLEAVRSESKLGSSRPEWEWERAGVETTGVEQEWEQLGWRQLKGAGVETIEMEVGAS